jgi:hypothetical protein
VRGVLLLLRPRFHSMVLFQRGYSCRSRTNGGNGVGGDIPDIAGYAKQTDVDAAILASESGTVTRINAVDAKTVDVETRVASITEKVVLTDGNGNVNGRNGSSALQSMTLRKGVITLVPNDLFDPLPRIATRDLTIPEPEFLEGKVEASGTGVPADGYAFYRYDDSDVINGLNSRVEIEMPKNTSKGYIFGRDLTIGTDSKSDSQYNVLLNNAKCITDMDVEEIPTSLVSKQYIDSNCVQVNPLEGELDTYSISMPNIVSWLQPAPFSSTNITGWTKYPPDAPEQVIVTDDGMVVSPTRMGVQFVYSVPPLSIDAVGMDHTSPINSIDFTGLMKLPSNFSVVKLWLMDETDPSTPKVFYEAALSNVDGKLWFRNEYYNLPGNDGRELDMEPEKTDPITYNSIVDPVEAIYLAPHNLLARSEEFENVTWIAFPTLADMPIQANSAFAPDGRLTAEIIRARISNAGIRQVVPAKPWTTYTFFVWIRSVEADAPVQLQMISNNGNRHKDVTATSEWKLVSSSRVTYDTNTNMDVRIVLKTANSSIMIWGAQLNVASTITGTIRNDDFSIFQPISVGLNSVDTINPFKTLGATKFVATTGNVIHRVELRFPLAALVTYTMSVYVKRETYPIVRLACTSSGVGNFCNVFLDLDTRQNVTGASSALWTVLSTSVEDVGDGWNRCILTFKPSAVNGTSNIDIGSAPTRNASSYNGDNVSGSIFWGFQLEIGSIATPYISNIRDLQWKYNETTDMPYIAPRLKWTDTTTTQDLATSTLPVKISIWSQGGKLSIGDRFVVPLYVDNKKLRCVFVTETGGHLSDLAMVKKSVALCLNRVDATIEPSDDTLASLGTSKRKWKAVHASEFDAYDGFVKNVKFVTGDKTFLGFATPQTYIQELFTIENKIQAFERNFASMGIGYVTSAFVNGTVNFRLGVFAMPQNTISYEFNVDRAFLVYTLYDPSLQIIEDGTIELTITSRGPRSLDFIQSETKSSATGRSNKDILKLRCVVSVTQSTISREVVCFTETMTNFTNGYYEEILVNGRRSIKDTIDKIEIAKDITPPTITSLVLTAIDHVSIKLDVIVVDNLKLVDVKAGLGLTSAPTVEITSKSFTDIPTNGVIATTFLGLTPNTSYDIILSVTDANGNLTSERKSISTKMDPEDWWAAGVNINYRTELPSRQMFQIKDTSGFTGGNVKVGAVVYDNNDVTSISFQNPWGAEPTLADFGKYSAWIFSSKFGTNTQRKMVMDLIQAQTSSVLKPEFRTWADPEDWWAAGVNIQYRQTGSVTVNGNLLNHSMFHFRNNTGFSGGASAGLHVLGPGLTNGSIQFYSASIADVGNIDEESIWEGWVIKPKFGDNIDRKKAIDLIEQKFGLTFNPLFKTWV